MSNSLMLFGLGVRKHQKVEKRCFRPRLSKNWSCKFQLCQQRHFYISQTRLDFFNIVKTSFQVSIKILVLPVLRLPCLHETLKSEQILIDHSLVSNTFFINIKLNSKSISSLMIYRKQYFVVKLYLKKIFLTCSSKLDVDSMLHTVISFVF